MRRLEEAVAPLTRQERERRAMEEEIVATSLAMVRAEGAANLSLRRVAERMEYSSAALYRYFPDKAALVDEICRRGFAELSRRLTAVPDALPPLERLARSARAYLQFAADEPHLYTLMFVDMLPGPANQPAPITVEHLLGDTAFGAIHRVLAEGAAAGAFRLAPERVLPATLASWALVHGLAMLRARMPGAFDEATLAAALALVATGLTSDR
jgi:AcrR family transcriptional regulator